MGSRGNEFHGTEYCRVYSAVSKDSGRLYILVKGNQDVLFFEEDHSITYMSNSNGVNVDEWIRNNFNNIEEVTEKVSMVFFT